MYIFHTLVLCNPIYHPLNYWQFYDSLEHMGILYDFECVGIFILYFECTGILYYTLNALVFVYNFFWFKHFRIID